MYSNFIKRLNRANDKIIWVEKWICAILFCVLIFFLVAQVFCRFILKVPAPWTEELARYSFIAAMYLACGYTLHYGKHVDMNLLDSFLNKAKDPKKAFFIESKLTMLANLFFCGYFVSLYYPFLMKIRANGKMAVTVELPLWIVMASVLIGFILMFWHSLVMLLQPYEQDGKPAENS